MMRKLFGRVRLAYLILASIFYRTKAGLRLVGTEFDIFGRKLSFQFLLKKDKNRFINYTSRDYQNYQAISQLPGIGVCGMAFMKE
ncbi:MAG: hypothetical protein KKD92_15630 [Proteobacteria bacterium]|nr:hypothetical protein [Pseudomonadota bacterium]